MELVQLSSHISLPEDSVTLGAKKIMEGVPREQERGEEEGGPFLF